MPTIIADDREAASGIVELLRENQPECEIVVGRLTVGDYQIGPDTVVERKTVDDFCRSLIDGRLFRQTYRLAITVDAPILLVEGKWQNRASEIGDAAIRGALATLAQSFRLPILYSEDPAGSARLLLVLTRQRQRLDHATSGNCGRRPKRPHLQTLRLLQTLPGIGRHKARQLLEHFGSIRAVIAADRQSLQEVPGIGSETATRIEELVSQPPSA